MRGRPATSESADPAFRPAATTLRPEATHERARC